MQLLCAKGKGSRKVDSLSLKQLAELASDEWQSLADENKLLRVALDLCPWPMWLKRLEEHEGISAFRMLWINEAYEKRWGIPKDRYEGHFDFEIWGEATGRQFARNDFKAVASAPHPLYTEEVVPEDLEYDGEGKGMHPKSDRTSRWRVAKVAAQQGVELHVFGIAWRLDEQAEHLPGGAASHGMPK